MKKDLSNNLLKVVAVIVVIACFCTGCNSGGEKDAEFVFRVALLDSSAELTSAPNSMSIISFTNAVTERTGGNVQFKIFPDGQLASGSDQLIAGTQLGAFDIFSLSPGNWGGYTDAFAPLNIPYLFLDAETADAFVDGRYGDQMSMKAEADTGIRPLAFLDIGFRQTTNGRRAIRSLEDLKGLKIRTMSDPIQIRLFEELGATVQQVPYSELFTALQQGMVDGQENPLINIKSQNLYEAQRYMTLTNHSYTFTLMAMNSEKFNSLPVEYQRIILEEARNAELSCRELCQAQEQEILEFLEQYMEVYVLNAQELEVFRKQVKGSWSMIGEIIGKKELDAILDEVRCIEETLR